MTDPKNRYDTQPILVPVPTRDDMDQWMRQLRRNHIAARNATMRRLFGPYLGPIVSALYSANTLAVITILGLIGGIILLGVAILH